MICGSMLYQQNQYFQRMEKVEETGRKTGQYFKNIAGQNHHNKSLDEVLKKAEQNVKSNIEDGKLLVEDEDQHQYKQEVMNNLLKRREIDPFQSRYRGFLLNSDREKSQQRYEIFKKIKLEYSKEKTAVVVKDVQNKIREWTNKKIKIQKRRQRSQQRKKVIEKEVHEDLKRRQREKKQEQTFNRKEELTQRLQILEEKRKKREEFIRYSQERTKQIKSPKYKDFQQKFKDIEDRMNKERQKILQEKKQSQVMNKQELKEHSKKYKSLLKERDQDRKKKAKFKIQINTSLVDRGEFNTFTHDHKAEKDEEDKKRRRRKEFQDKVKSMAVLKKDHGLENSQEKERSINKSVSRVKDNEETSLDGSRPSINRVKRREPIPTADPRKLGNDYLKQLRSKSRVQMGKSLSLPKIVKEIQSKPSYKNYLTQAKIHLKKKVFQDQIDEVKRECRSQSQIFQKLNKKSQGYESNMLRKIKELGKINQYDDSVKKQSEIDELHAKYIKMRLACIDD